MNHATLKNLPAGYRAEGARCLLRSCATILTIVVAFVAVASPVRAGLIGTELSLLGIFQATPTSDVELVAFLTTVIVTEPGVEFTSVNDLEVPGGLTLVDVAINVGEDFLEIDFDNVTHNSFASGVENTYVFTFDSSVAIEFVAASIDTSVTTLGLDPQDVTFAGNQLRVNVEGLPFNTSTFARINLESVHTEIQGDLNGDGFVGVDDLNLVLVNWNQNVTPGDLSSGDPSGEGFVGVDDLNIVLVNWNSGTPPGDLAFAMIPEPGALALLSLSGVVLLGRKTKGTKPTR